MKTSIQLFSTFDQKYLDSLSCNTASFWEKSVSIVTNIFSPSSQRPFSLDIVTSNTIRFNLSPVTPFFLDRSYRPINIQWQSCLVLSTFFLFFFVCHIYLDLAFFFLSLAIFQRSLIKLFQRIQNTFHKIPTSATFFCFPRKLIASVAKSVQYI